MLDMTRPSLKMIAVGSACKDALPSPQKNEALKHYAAAVEARVSMREAESDKQLNAAAQALAWIPRYDVTTITPSGFTKIAAAPISKIGQNGSSVLVRTPSSPLEGSYR
jgi:hypothetical protein